LDRRGKIGMRKIRTRQQSKNGNKEDKNWTAAKELE